MTIIKHPEFANRKLLARFYLLHKLVIFFLLILFYSCRVGEDNSTKKVSIVFTSGRASGLEISRSRLADIPVDSIPGYYQIKLANHGEQPVMAGNYLLKDDEVIFEPLIPFTKGLAYKIFLHGQSVETIVIPKATDSPKLLAIYPSADTVPSNLLKMYLVFSLPMTQGHSLGYIKLTNKEGDSLPNIFLDLPTELWNPDRTMLTIWFDPGRIKRGLQPNKQWGPPLIAGKAYKLIISNQWPAEDGNDLSQTYTKNMVASAPDTLRVEMNKWKLIIPKSGMLAPLEIDFDRPLDYELILNAVHIADSSGNMVTCTMRTNMFETKLYFTPAGPWKKGSYSLLAEGRLADLAGNSLNRLFDVDLNSSVHSAPSKKIFEREWRIE